MAMNDNNPIPEFGIQQPGQTYVPRPGSYALIRNGSGRIAVLQTPRGYYLPGGGSENGETPQETLMREAQEECGFCVYDVDRLCEAVEYVYTPGNESGIRKECTFFVATVGETSGGGVEEDHTLVWLPPETAETLLAHGSQRWAVRQFMSRRQ